MECKKYAAITISHDDWSGDKDNVCGVDGIDETDEIWKEKSFFDGLTIKKGEG